MRIRGEFELEQIRANSNLHPYRQEHRPQRPTEHSDPTQHAKGRMGDRPGPRKGATTQRNVTQGGLSVSALRLSALPAPSLAVERGTPFSICQVAVSHHVPNVQLVGAWDTSHKTKSHPRDKVTIARRMAAVLAHRLYAHPVPAAGPELRAVACAWDGRSYAVRLDFSGPQPPHHLGTTHGFGRCVKSPFAVSFLEQPEAAAPRGRAPEEHGPADGDREAEDGPVWSVLALDAVTVRGAVTLLVAPRNGLPPLHVRYAYFNTPRCTLYDELGWPAMPFAAQSTRCPRGST